MMEPAEPFWRRFRGDPSWRVYYENNQGTIFERR
jgi:hypothetical protein